MRIILPLIFLALFSTLYYGNAQDVIPLAEVGRGTPRSVLFDPTGEHLFVVTQQDELWTYEVATGVTLRHAVAVKSAWFFPNGDWFMTQATDDLWRVYHTTDLVTPVLDHLIYFGLSPNDRWLIVHDREQNISLRDADFPLQARLENIDDVLFSPNGEYVITKDLNGNFEFRDADLSLFPVQPNIPANTTRILWSPDESRVLGLTDSNQRHVIHLFESSRDRTLTVSQPERYTAHQWSPDGVHFLDHDYAGHLRVWNVDTGDLVLYLPTRSVYHTPEELAEIQFRAPNIWMIEWSKDGSHIFRCNSAGGSIDVLCGFFSLETGLATQRVGSDLWSFIIGRNYSPDDQYLVLTEGVYDANTGDILADFSEGRQGGYTRHFSSDSRFVVTSPVFMQNTSYLYNLETFEFMHTLEFNPYAYDAPFVVWSPDNIHFVKWGGSGLISLWNAELGQVVWHLHEHVKFGQEVIFNTDETLLAATDMLGNVAVIELATGEHVSFLEGPQESIQMIDWQPDGDLIAASSGRYTGLGTPFSPPFDGNRVFVWHVMTGELVYLFEHETTIRSIAWHPSGDYLVVEDETSQMRIWDLNTGELSSTTEIAIGYHYQDNYIWGANGDIGFRYFSSCSHAPHPSVQVFNFTERRFWGTLYCDTTTKITVWNTELNGAVDVRNSCWRLKNGRCFIEVRIFNEDYFFRYPSDAPFRNKSIYQITYDQAPITVTISPSNSRIVVQTETGVDLWRLGREQAQLDWSLEGEYLSAEWSHDDEYVLLLATTHVDVVNVKTGEIQFTIETLSAPTAVSWRHDNAFFFLVFSNEIRVYPMRTGEEILVLRDVSNVLWMNDYLQVDIVSSGERRRELWDVKLGYALLSSGDILFYHNNVHNFITVTSDARFGVQNSQGVLQIWNFDDFMKDS